MSEAACTTPLAALAGPSRPLLHLAGAKLRGVLERLLASAEEQGGIERIIDALALKSKMFKQALVVGDLRDLDLDTLAGLCAFMTTVRRRIAPYLTADGLDCLRAALADLLDEQRDVDLRLANFMAAFPRDREHRWVRDFAAEVLHNVAPERYPLMTRWMWDATANTGVLREIWYAPDIDSRSLAIGDDWATFITLREELAQFLRDNGFFRDMLFYVDLVQAAVYAEYLAEQGGSYLRTDFSEPEDPMRHVRRMLGLDGVRVGSSKTRLKAIDGTAYVLAAD